MLRLVPILLIPVALWSAEPQSAEHWRKIGLAAISVGNFNGAGPALQKACELERVSGDSCYYYGRNLHALGDFQAASVAYEYALKASPRDLIGRIYRAAGLNHIALGSNAEAELYFRRAIALGRPDQEDVRIDLGSLLFRQGRLAEAQKLLDAAVTAKPDSARANLEYGRILLHLEQLPAAVEKFEAAIRLNPADWNAHLLLGRAYQRVGRDADAERELQLGRSGWRQTQP